MHGGDLVLLDQAPSISDGEFQMETLGWISILLNHPRILSIFHCEWCFFFHKRRYLF